MCHQQGYIGIDGYQEYLLRVLHLVLVVCPLPVTDNQTRWDNKLLSRHSASMYCPATMPGKPSSEGQKSLKTSYFKNKV